MFKAAQSAVRAAIKSRNPEISELPLILPSCMSAILDSILFRLTQNTALPESYSLSQLSAIIASTDELASEEVVSSLPYETGRSSMLIVI